MQKVTLRGTGQLKGPVIINKVLELDDQVADSLRGQNRDKVLLDLMKVHYPGVSVNPKNISANITQIYEKEDHNSFGKFLKKNKPKSSFSITSVLMWIVFFPFKLVWWILKGIWKDKDHMSGKWQ